MLFRSQIWVQNSKLKPVKPTAEAIEVVSLMKASICFICGSTGHLSGNCKFNIFIEKPDVPGILATLLKRNKLKAGCLSAAVLAACGVTQFKGKAVTEEQVKALIADRSGGNQNGNRRKDRKGKQSDDNKGSNGTKDTARQCPAKGCQCTGKRYDWFHPGGEKCFVVCIRCYKQLRAKGVSHQDAMKAARKGQGANDKCGAGGASKRAYEKALKNGDIGTSMVTPVYT